MSAADWATEARAIAARWEHGHDGLTPGCALCEGEYAEVQALTEHHRLVSYASTTDFLEQPVTHPLSTDHGHPVTIATNDDGERDITWSCPTACPAPDLDSCATINALRNDTGWYGPELPDGPYLATRGLVGLIIDHPDGSSVNTSTMTTLPTEFEVSLLPEDHEVYRYYVVTVRRTPDGWGVFNRELCLRTDGTGWDDSVITAGTPAAFLSAHRFAFEDQAREAAEKAAPDVAMYGVTAHEIWTKNDNTRRVREIFGASNLPGRWRVRHDTAALEVLAVLAPQMGPRAAAAWMTANRYPSTNGDRNALHEISMGNGHHILDQARSQAAPANGEGA